MTTPSPDDSARYWVANHDDRDTSRPNPATEFPPTEPERATEPSTVTNARVTRALIALGLGTVFVVVMVNTRFGAAGWIFLPFVLAWAANVYLGAGFNDPLTHLIARYREHRVDGGSLRDLLKPTTTSGVRQQDERGPTVAHESGAEPERGAQPMVRSFTDALPTARRLIDAVLLLGFGILSFVFAGSGATDKTAITVIIGIAAVVYAGYVAFSRGSYVMPYWIYALAVLGLLVFFFGKGFA
jgi:hypothetical protein